MKSKSYLSVLMILGFVQVAFADGVHLVLSSPLGSRHLNFPLRATLVNEGSATSGMLSFDSYGQHVSFDVELPAHSKVAKWIFPADLGYGPSLMPFSGRVRLDTPMGSDVANIPEIDNDGYQISYFQIGDGTAPSQTTRFDSPGNEIRRAYLRIRAEDAPTRSGDFGVSFRGVFLVPGAERLSDASFRALVLYVEQGGRVVISGGVNSPYLKDPRWQELLPLKFGKAREENLASVIGADAKGKGPVLRVTPIVGSPGWSLGAGGMPRLLAVQPIGGGQLVYVGFDLDEAGRASGSVVDKAFDFPYLGVQQLRVYSALPELTRLVPGATGIPLAIPMPTTGSMATILVAFLALAVPANFFILRRIRRREWAWYTAPAISLIFTGVMLTKAGALYKVPTSTAVTASIHAFDGQSLAAVTGQSTTFLRDSRSIAFDSAGVDTAFVRDRAARENYEGSINFSDFNNPIHIQLGKGVRIQAIQPSSLSLHTVAFTGHVANDFLQLKTARGGYVVIARANVKDALLITHDGIYLLGDLGAGTSRFVSLSGGNYKLWWAPIHQAATTKNTIPFDIHVPLFDANLEWTSGAIIQPYRAPKSFQDAVDGAAAWNVAVWGKVDLPVGPSAGKRVGDWPTFTYVSRLKP